MRLRFAALAIGLCGLLASCSRQEAKFVMPVDQVQHLQGFILKGLSITGKVTKGCIANDNEFTITRNGKLILTTSVRLLSIEELRPPLEFNGEAYLGETATFYLPDIKDGEVLKGDQITSLTANCTLGPPRK